jgi:hypothetical protein
MSINISGASIQTTSGSNGATIENVSFAGSGLTFVNTFTANVTQAYENCAIAAEQNLASEYTNSTTINVEFDAENEGNTGDLASNSWYYDKVSYSALKGALTSLSEKENNIDLALAVETLPTADPSNGAGFELPIAYARMLGLTTSTGSPDDTVTLNTYYNWSYGQDVTNTLEHEISEGGMGRVGGLGDQNSGWSTMDLFRFNASGARDYTDGRDGQTTYFSYDGGAKLSLSAGLSFNNEYNANGTFNNGGDTADFVQQDVFGTGTTGETNTLSQTDLAMLDVLGWAPNTTKQTQVRVRADFNGDLTSDILWRNTNGDTVGWISNGSGGLGVQDFGVVSTGYQVSGIGDFNGDGESDVLWRNTANGDTLLWNSNGAGGFSTQDLGVVGTGYQIAGTGDFNGDGKADILWRNTGNGDTVLWSSNGAGGFSTQELGVVSTGYQVAGVGDFNGDGKADILWRNTANGDTLLWDSNGAGGFSTQDLGVVSTGYQVAGIGDFNGDGKADILWRNTSNGDAVLWNSNGAGGFGTQDLGVVGTSYQVASIGDYNGDGKDGILWNNTATGDTVLWNSNPGGGGFTTHDLGAVATSYHVQAG